MEHIVGDHYRQEEMREAQEAAAKALRRHYLALLRQCRSCAPFWALLKDWFREYRSTRQAIAQRFFPPGSDRWV